MRHMVHEVVARVTYKTRTRRGAGQRCTPPTPSLLCLQDPHEAWSPVSGAHPLSPLPTRPERGVVAGQRCTPPLSSAYKTRTRRGRRSEVSLLCLQDPNEAWSPVRDAHPLSPLPTRPARGVVAGQRHSHPSLLCLQDPHEAWSPVRDAHPLSPLTTCGGLVM